MDEWTVCQYVNYTSISIINMTVLSLLHPWSLGMLFNDLFKTMPVH